MNRYLVMVLRTGHFDTALVPAHRTFLADLRERGHLDLAGPFTDGSGGAYLLRADHLQQAETLAHADPLHASGASNIRVYEWQAA